MTDIRYTCPTADGNRSRWPDDPLWMLCRQQLSGDLFEMMCASEPGAVREVIRQHQAELIGGQIIGLSATWGTIAGFDPTQGGEVVSAVSEMVRTAYERDKPGYEKRMEKAEQRYAFIAEMPHL